MAVNVRGAFNMVQAAGPMMEARGSGKIINITSGTVYRGMPNMLHYITSKYARVAPATGAGARTGAEGDLRELSVPGLNCLQHRGKRRAYRPDP
ncbi:MAG: SDR family NAD(P)-dependent oxidoreductase [Paracoccaceae bacterium]